MAGFFADQFVISGALSGFRHAEPTGKRMSKRADSATFTHFSPQGRSRSLLWLCAHGTLTELQEVPALRKPNHCRRTIERLEESCLDADVSWCGRRSDALAVICAENAYIPELLLAFIIDTSSGWGRGHECKRRSCPALFVFFGSLHQDLACAQCSRGEDHE